MEWMRYISLWFYGNEAYNINQWKDIDEIKCDLPNEAECLTDGKDVLKFYAFKEVKSIESLTK